MRAEQNSYDIINDGKQIMKLSYHTARSLGSASRWIYDSCCGAGRVIGEGLRFPSKLIQKSKTAFTKRASSHTQGRVFTDIDSIRYIVIEELTRMQGDVKETFMKDVENRLRLLANTLEAMRGQIDELSTRGPVSEADAWKTMQSIKPAEYLSHDEKTLLVNIFRQNMALQRPEHVGATQEPVPSEGLS